MQKHMTIRNQTKEINISELKIGGGNPIAVQSMTNTDTRDVDATVAQIERLTEAGCELVRVAVPDMDAAAAISDIKRRISIPLAADIHFDYRLALAAMENGVDKLRINPGNIGGVDRVRRVADMAKERGVPIRIGVNAGSLERDILSKYGGITAEGLVESALGHVNILECMGFDQIVISIKSSDVSLSIAAYEELSQMVRYPLHVGITEAGTVYGGSIKSAAGIGAILSRGIGDTIRVSLTGDPVEEIRCAREILKALGLRSFGPVLVSCPTCGRTEIDLATLAAEVERYCSGLSSDIKVAVMGCAVNGPGEARDADVGVAGGKACGLIFKKGEVVRKVPENELLDALKAEINNLVQAKA